jgi:hypothetical protein
MNLRLSADSPHRRWAIALALYVGCCAVFAVVAGSQRLTEHTPFNHYALMANAWLHGRLDLPGGPPAYAQNNDFAEFGGKTYISFPRTSRTGSSSSGSPASVLRFCFWSSRSFAGCSNRFARSATT